MRMIVTHKDGNQWLCFGTRSPKSFPVYARDLTVIRAATAADFSPARLAQLRMDAGCSGNIEQMRLVDGLNG